MRPDITLRNLWKLILIGIMLKMSWITSVNKLTAPSKIKNENASRAGANVLQYLRRCYGLYEY